MHDRLILPRHFSERPALNLSRTAFSRVAKGGIRVMGTWHRDDEGERPCLVLVRAIDPPSRWMPCIIRIDTVWVWTEEAGDPVKATEEAMYFAERLGLNPFWSKDLVRIIAAVRDNLADLKSMPPAPPGERRVIGEVAVVEVESDEVIRQEDVVDHV